MVESLKELQDQSIKWYHCFPWHTWTQWEKYFIQGIAKTHPFSKETIEFSQLRVQRKCITCGKIQDKKIMD